MIGKAESSRLGSGASQLRCGRELAAQTRDENYWVIDNDCASDYDEDLSELDGKSDATATRTPQITNAMRTAMRTTMILKPTKRSMAEHYYATASEREDQKHKMHQMVEE
jgi:hypothetical protein